MPSYGLLGIFKHKVAGITIAFNKLLVLLVVAEIWNLLF
jgi:hypothetical protein